MTKKNPEPELISEDASGTDVTDQVAELTIDLQRLQAEFINYKRRAETENLSRSTTPKWRSCGNF
ncbi:hypothetical protein IPG36_01025 [bacterium]|nr:MAG: hypothetical protein IPG36_01025 [bacterium]